MRTALIGSSDRSTWEDTWHKAVTAIVFAAFFWISLVSQTHIHGQLVDLPSLAPVSSAAVSETVGGSDTQALKAPLQNKSSDDDLGSCPLCQAVHKSGTFIAPFITFLISWPAFHAVLPHPVASVDWTSFPGHDLQTRGPPSP